MRFSKNVVFLQKICLTKKGISGIPPTTKVVGFLPEHIMTKDDATYKEIRSYDKNILSFDRNTPGMDFIPAHYLPKKDGLYVTIRCGLAGIRQTLNEWKDGVWQMNCLDGSVTIAYSRNTVELKTLNKELTK